MADDPSAAPKAREPIFNIPWPIAVLGISIVGGYAIQSLLPIEAVVAAWGFSAAQLRERPETLVTAILLHGSWPHALMNAVFGIAFGAPVARFFGLGGRGVSALLFFYVVCGVLANLAFAAIHPREAIPLVGASGAISGLMGAAARLIGGGGWPGPIFSAPVLALGAATIIANLLVASTGLAPGLGDSTIAWEAHLAGYLAGVLLIGPAARHARG
jgi:membrane associated rhomboid family serine protease